MAVQDDRHLAENSRVGDGHLSFSCCLASESSVLSSTQLSTKLVYDLVEELQKCSNISYRRFGFSS